MLLCEDKAELCAALHMAPGWSPQSASGVLSMYVGKCSEAYYLERNSAMDDSIEAAPRGDAWGAYNNENTQPTINVHNKREAHN